MYDNPVMGKYGTAFYSIQTQTRLNNTLETLITSSPCFERIGMTSIKQAEFNREVNGINSRDENL